MISCEVTFARIASGPISWKKGQGLGCVTEEAGYAWRKTECQSAENEMDSLLKLGINSGNLVSLLYQVVIAFRDYRLLNALGYYRSKGP